MQTASLRIKNIEKIDVQADNNTMLDVTFEFLEGDTVIEERRQSFPLDTTPEKMQEELTKVLTTFNSDRSLTEQNAELEAAHKTADETIEQVVGLTIAGQDVDSRDQFNAELKEAISGDAEDTKEVLPSDPVEESANEAEATPEDK